MSDPEALHALLPRLQAAFDAGQVDRHADELREACRPVVPQDGWEKAHAWKLSVTIRDAYERGYTVRQGRYRLPAVIAVVDDLAGAAQGRE
jgi:hypothetical protein